MSSQFERRHHHFPKRASSVDISWRQVREGSTDRTARQSKSTAEHLIPNRVGLGFCTGWAGRRCSAHRPRRDPSVPALRGTLLIQVKRSSPIRPE